GAAAGTAAADIRPVGLFGVPGVVDTGTDSDRARGGSYESVAAGSSRSTSTWRSFPSVRKVLRSMKQGACTALPVGTWNGPKCRLHSLTCPSRTPAPRTGRESWARV